MLWSIKAMSGQRSNLLNRKDLSIKRTTLSLTEELRSQMKSGKGEIDEEVDIAAIDCPWSSRKEREK